MNIRPRPDDSPALVRLRPTRGVDAVGVFAVRPITAGSLVLPFPGTPVDAPDRYTIQIDETTHLRGGGTPADELRHACEPNAHMLVEDAPPAVVIALRDIEPGEEVTIDYCATEAELAEPFVCSCGSARCYGLVRGYAHLAPDQRARLRGRASTWLADVFSPDPAA